MTLPLFNLRRRQRRTQSRARPRRGSEIIEKKLRDPLHQDPARRRIADAVAAAGKWQNLDVRKGPEIAHAVALVGKLLRSHAEMQRRLESMPAPCRAAIVE